MLMRETVTLEACVYWIRKLWVYKRVFVVEENCYIASVCVQERKTVTQKACVKRRDL